MLVVAAIDSTSAAPRVLAVARGVADALGVPVRALHVRGAGAVPVAVARASRVGLDVVDGEPVSTVVEAFARPGVLGIIGARARPEDPRPAGGVAAEVITRTSRPVVVVGPGVRIARRLGRALVPLDGTAVVARAVEPVIRLLTGADVDVVIEHVFGRDTVPRFWDQPQHEGESWSREFSARWCGYPVAVVAWRQGEPAVAILTAAGNEDVDLIVVGWGQDPSAGRGSVIKAALRAAPVPVLLVPCRPRGDAAAAGPGPAGR